MQADLNKIAENLDEIKALMDARRSINQIRYDLLINNYSSAKIQYSSYDLMKQIEIQILQVYGIQDVSEENYNDTEKYEDLFNSIIKGLNFVLDKRNGYIK